MDGHHSGEVVDSAGVPGGGFLARDWTLLGGGTYARKSYQITTPEAVETATMILKHTP